MPHQSEPLLKHQDHQLLTAVARKMHRIFFGTRRSRHLSIQGSFVISGNSHDGNTMTAETSLVLTQEQQNFLSGYAAALCDQISDFM